MIYVKTFEMHSSDESHYYDKSNEGGSIQGIIHSDMGKINNWFLKRNIDPNEYDAHIQTPIAFLNNINVDVNKRGDGYGFELFDKFEDFCIEMGAVCIILESDSSEEQVSGFKLDSWYEGLGFEVIGNSGGNSVMYKDINDI